VLQAWFFALSRGRVALRRAVCETNPTTAWIPQLSLDQRASMLWFFGNAREHFKI
jgi:hypothetical protein